MLRRRRHGRGRAALIAAVQDFDFMGGSLGMAAGEAIITGAEAAVERQQPYVLFAGSGGARMQEGILSLMQLPRTTVAVDMVKEAGLPYIVVLTNPTTGGVTASYAMLGDVHLAEPGALIGFAGPRVIEQTIREKLPEGLPALRILLDHGMVDIVVHRHKLRETVARLCRLLLKLPPANHPPPRNGPAMAAGIGGGNGAAGCSRIGRRKRLQSAPPAARADLHVRARFAAGAPGSAPPAKASTCRSAASSSCSTGSAGRRTGCRRSSMSPAPTAKARPSPFCARCSRPPASACTSTPRRTSCASTSASASAAWDADSLSTTRR